MLYVQRLADIDLRSMRTGGAGCVCPFLHINGNFYGVDHLRTGGGCEAESGEHNEDHDPAPYF